jgi:hypothetical protein
MVHSIQLVTQERQSRSRPTKMFLDADKFVVRPILQPHKVEKCRRCFSARLRGMHATVHITLVSAVDEMAALVANREGDRE